METYDIIIVNRTAGLFDAGLLVRDTAQGDNGNCGPSFFSKEYTITTGNEEVVNMVHTQAYESAMRGIPRDYKSRIIGPGFQLDGVWSRSLDKLDDVWVMKIVNDRASSTGPHYDNINDLRLISKFVMEEFKPDGKFLYGYAMDDIKGYCIVVDRGSRVAVFWDSGPIELGNNLTVNEPDDGFDINIANPDCGKIAREWLMETDKAPVV